MLKIEQALRVIRKDLASSSLLVFSYNVTSFNIVSLELITELRIGLDFGDWHGNQRPPILISCMPIEASLFVLHNLTRRNAIHLLDLFSRLIIAKVAIIQQDINRCRRR